VATAPTSDGGERRNEANEARTRGRLAMVAFLAHGPGLYLLAKRPMSSAWLRWNVLALTATATAMVVSAFLLLDRGLAGMGIAVSWMIGHFVWGVLLARGVLSGAALKERRRRPR
jgi:hypothetical protein